MSQFAAHVPTQAAEFSGPGKHAIVLYASDWSELVQAILVARPVSYEAAWHYHEQRRAHILGLIFPDGTALNVAFVDGVHNALLAHLARGSALVLSPFPLYGETADERPRRAFTPEESLALPTIPSPLNL